MTQLLIMQFAVDDGSGMEVIDASMKETFDALDLFAFFRASSSIC
jgi:hypothetical protein